MVEHNELGRSTGGTLSGSNLHPSGLEISSGSSHTDEMEDADFDEVDYLVSNTGQHSPAFTAPTLRKNSFYQGF